MNDFVERAVFFNGRSTYKLKRANLAWDVQVFFLIKKHVFFNWKVLLGTCNWSLLLNKKKVSSLGRGSNLCPTDLETTALPTELLR